MHKPVCLIYRTSVLCSTDSRGLAGGDLNFCSSNQGVTLNFSIVLYTNYCSLYRWIYFNAIGGFQVKSAFVNSNIGLCKCRYAIFMYISYILWDCSFLVSCLFECVSFPLFSLSWLLVSLMKWESYLKISSSDDVTV